MGIISYILIGYLAVAIFTGIRLGWHMAVRLDRFDWECSKSQIWTTFTIFVLFWPLILFAPKIIVNPTRLFEGGHLSKLRREECRLWNNPPPCGSLIIYRQGSGRYEETFGEFIFRSDDIEKELELRIGHNTHLADNHEGAILHWLQQRDNQLTEPTLVPEIWNRFQFVADNLLRNGMGEIKCLKCNKQIPINDLHRQDDRDLPGWNFNRLQCPHGHPLLVTERIHVLLRETTALTQ